MEKEYTITDRNGETINLLIEEDGKVFYAYDGEKEYEREAVKARLELNIPHVNPFMYNSTL